MFNKPLFTIISLFLVMLLLLLAALCLANGVLSHCDAKYGPAGRTECFQIQYYNTQQWATCLSNDYIKLKSHQRHSCDPSQKYCFYQCMVEVYGLDYGNVLSDCLCTRNSKDSPRLASSCLSPSGKSCDWYRDCFEKKYSCHSCKDTSNAYAIRFAERFCNAYEWQKIFGQFSADYVQQWLDAVRKCLQITLVPMLRPWRSPCILPWHTYWSASVL